MQNLQNHTVPNTFTFKENAIIWYFSLLLNRAHADDMTKFDNGILITYRMCPLVELMQYYQMDPMTQPTHFMRGTATKVWGDDVFEAMHTTAADWDSDDNDDSPKTSQHFSLFFLLRWFSVIFYYGAINFT